MWLISALLHLKEKLGTKTNLLIKCLIFKLFYNYQNKATYLEANRQIHLPKATLLQRIEEELFEKQLEVRINLQKSSQIMH